VGVRLPKVRGIGEASKARVKVLGEEETKIYVHLPVSLRQALKEHCKGLGIPMSTFVRMLIIREIGWKPEEVEDESVSRL